jgi:hypothetical protein
MRLQSKVNIIDITVLKYVVTAKIVYLLQYECKPYSIVLY